MRSFQPGHKRPVGTTGISVSPLALGTAKFGRNTHVKYPRHFDLPDNKQIRCLLSKAAELGVNLLDTAPAYGSSEEKLGQALAGSRHDWVICTKVGETYRAGVSTWNFSEAAINRSIEASLRSLATNWIDIVLLHSDGDDLNILQHTDALETLLQHKIKGNIRSFGISTKSREGVLSSMDHVDLIMMSPLPAEGFETSLLARIRAAGCGILVKKPLASGHNSNIPEAFSRVFAHPEISSAVVGTLSADHLRENVDAVLEAIER